MKSNTNLLSNSDNQAFSKDIYILLVILVLNGAITYIIRKYYSANTEEIRSWAIWNFRGIKDFFKFGSQTFTLPLFSIFMIPIEAIGPTIWLILVQKKRGGNALLWGMFCYLSVWNALFYYFIDSINSMLANRFKRIQNYSIDKLILFLIPILFVIKANSKVSYFLLVGLKSPLYYFFTNYLVFAVLGLVYSIWFISNKSIQGKMKWVFTACGFVYGTVTVLIYMVYDAYAILTHTSKDTKGSPENSL